MLSQKLKIAISVSVLVILVIFLQTVTMTMIFAIVILIKFSLQNWRDKAMICKECERYFNLFNEDDAAEFYFGHDCES